MKIKLLSLFILFQSLTASAQNTASDNASSAKNQKILDSLFTTVFPKLPKSDPQKALLLYDEAETMLTKGTEKYASKIYLGKARLYNDLGDSEKASYWLDKSMQTAEANRDYTGQVSALQYKGIMYGMKNDLIPSAQYLNKAIRILENHLYDTSEDSLKNMNQLVLLKSNLSLNYTLQKKYSEVIDMSYSTLSMARKLKNKRAETLMYGYIGQAYKSLGQKTKAIEYYRKEQNSASEMKDSRLEAYSFLHLASMLDDVKDKNEILAYYKNALNIFENHQLHDGIFKVKIHIFSHYRLNKEYEKCLQMAPEILQLAESGNDDLSHFYTEMGEIYTRLGNFGEAQIYFDKAEKILDDKKLSKKYFLEKKALYEKEKGNLAAALELQKQESEIAQKEINKNFVNRIAHLETQYKVAEKNSEILKQKSKISTEVSKRKSILWTVGGLSALAFAAFLWYQRNQAQKALAFSKSIQELKDNMVILEMNNLNKQLDPHEIKNLLASISPEIQEKAPESYRKMLKLFNITKASLNNKSLTDSVENQVQQIDDFLSLEKQTMFEPLDYRIENRIQKTELQIPRLMLKNLVENAVKHGIKKKPGGGEINVILEEKNGFIHIAVDDTGKGRKESVSSDGGIGTSTYQKLFATLNQKNKEHASFEITDKSQGTKVEVKIPVDYKYS